MARELGRNVGRGAAASRPAAAALQRRAAPAQTRSQEQRPVALSRGGGGGRGGSVVTSRASSSSNPDEELDGWEALRQGNPSGQKPKADEKPLIPSRETEAAQLSPKRDVSDRLPAQWGEGPIGAILSGAAKFFVPLDPKNKNDAAALQAAKPESDKRANAQAGFQQTSNRTVKVREATPEEWAAMSSEQQQAVITSFALYQAGQADKAAAIEYKGDDESYNQLVASTFGEGGGSDTYAPNTVRLLQELGYQDETGDLDNFLNGQTAVTLNQINGVSPDAPRAGAAGVVDRLAASAVFDTPELSAQLESGAALLDAIRTNQSLTPEFMSFAGAGPSLQGLSETQLSDLNTTLNNMSNRGVWDLIQSDPDSNASLQADLQALVADLGEDTVTQYFANQLQGFGGDDTYMSFDEFSKSWLNGKS